MKRLCCDQEERLNVDEIKAHPFFKGIEWDKLRERKDVPILPKLKDKFDTSYFDNFEEEPDSEEENIAGKQHWPAFTFKSPALRRLALGTWGRGRDAFGTQRVRNFFNPDWKENTISNDKI